MSVSREDILNVLRGIALPGGGDLVSGDLIRAVMIDGDQVRFVIEAATPQEAAGLAAQRDAAEAAVKSMQGVGGVSVVLTAHGPSEKSAPPPDIKPRAQAAAQPRQKLSGVNRIVAIGSGKGGVGKSTVTSNLAVALAKQGRRVGLLDADIYGPSQPRMLGVKQRPDSTKDNRIIPLVAHGVKMISIGLMVDDDQPLAWRGPMLLKALQQLLGDVEWGKLDVLLIDLPPGTGDVQLTLSQKTEITGAVVVSTPQDIAMLDARKALDMFRKTGTKVLGIIENMSTHVCSECGHEEHIFGHGGAVAEAKKLNVPLLGEVPLDIAIRLAGDSGAPVVAAAPESAQAKAFIDIAAKLMQVPALRG